MKKTAKNSNILEIYLAILYILISFILSIYSISFVPKLLDIFSFVGLILAVIGGIVIAFSVKSCQYDLRMVDNKITPIATINVKEANRGMQVMCIGFGIQLACQYISIIPNHVFN